MAKFFPEELIQEVIAANDLADVVSSYVRLGRSGSGLSGLCPFHREKTPSFHVSPDKQLYHCFGCGKGGTVLNFIMEMENLDFVDAVKFLADRAGIRLPEPENAAQSAEFYQRKQKMLAMNRDAARFFYSQVQTPKAVEYLKSRGLSGKTVKHFGIGYTPGGDALTRHLEGLGYDQALMASAGLSAVSDKGRYYDRFRDRLMFPIIDVRQNIIGFGGRILGEGQPKYLNSPQSPVFDKGKNLYALSFAKSEPSKRLILAEGYMDVVSLHQAALSVPSLPLEQR